MFCSPQRTDCKAVVSVLPGQAMGLEGFQLSVSLSQAHLPRMWVEKHPVKTSQVRPPSSNLTPPSPRTGLRYLLKASRPSLLSFPGLHASLLSGVRRRPQVRVQGSRHRAGHIRVHEVSISWFGSEDRHARSADAGRQRQSQHHFVWHRLVFGLLRTFLRSVFFTFSISQEFQSVHRLFLRCLFLLRFAENWADSWKVRQRGSRSLKFFWNAHHASVEAGGC